MPSDAMDETAGPAGPPRPPPPPAAETLRLYASDWAAFRTWCRHANTPALPAAPATLAAYLAAADRLGPGALARHVAAIAREHRQHGHASPAADPAVKAILRQARRAAPRRRPPLAAVQLVRMAVACPRDLAGRRDRALLLLAAASGLGRADLVAIAAEQVRFTSAGFEVQIRARAAADGRMRSVTVRRAAPVGACPVQALEDWLRLSECRFGPVFRKVDRWGNVEHQALGTDAIRRIWRRRLARLRRGRRPQPAAL